VNAQGPSPRDRSAWVLLVLGVVGCSADPSAPVPPTLACARYRIVAADAGVGLVEDTATGLVWMRTPYYPGYPPGQKVVQASEHCMALGLRLPTLAEAQAITPRCRDAWPAPWFTWTSSISDAGQVLGMLHDGFVSSYGAGYDGRYGNGDVLCVRDAVAETR
jgi:hypothetical protein